MIVVRCLKRNKRTLYLCTCYQDNNITLYNEPIALDTNYQTTNSDGDLIALGEDYPMFIRIKTDFTQKDMFHSGDRVYVKDSPNTVDFDGLCEDADYEVESEPIESLNQIEVMLKRLSGKNQWK